MTTGRINQVVNSNLPGPRSGFPGPLENTVPAGGPPRDHRPGTCSPSSVGTPPVPRGPSVNLCPTTSCSLRIAASGSANAIGSAYIWLTPAASRARTRVRLPRRPPQYRVSSVGAAIPRLSQPWHLGDSGTLRLSGPRLTPASRGGRQHRLSGF